LSETLQGVVVSYKRGLKTQNPKESLIRFPKIGTRAEGSQLIGRKIAWPVGKHKCIGKVVGVHGNNGLVRARFRKGLPGTALGTKVEIVG
jgi:large subunit ribosomal protein L35Ae